MSISIVGPIRALPPDYCQVHYMQLTERGRLFWLNVLSVVPMIFSVFIVFGLLLAYHIAGAPLVIHALPDRLPMWLGIALVLLILPLHEWLHGWAIVRVGHRVRYGFKLVVLFATADGALFRRREFLQVTLAPLVIISLVGLVLMLFVPAGLAQWIAIAVIMNASGAIGDLWMTSVVMRFDSSVLIQDEENGMRIFAHCETVTSSQGRSS